MNQKKIEKLIWDISSKTKIPNLPNKEKAWESLVQNMDNLNSTKLVKKFNLFQSIINFWTPSNIIQLFKRQNKTRWW